MLSISQMIQEAVQLHSSGKFADAEAMYLKVLDRAPTLDERRRFARIATVTHAPGYLAERTPLDHPFAREMAAALRGNGPFVLLPGLGGSLPLHVIHAELASFSQSNRAPLVLCFLEGRTQDEAAKQLGVSKATLKRRLERGRSFAKAFGDPAQGNQRLRHPICPGPPAVR